MKTRHYLMLHKWSGEEISHVVSWNKFDEADKKFWLNHHSADYAVEQVRESLV